VAAITGLEFYNYKAFGRYSLNLQEMNILVGPNNCGKSTIVGAFRALAAGLRRARAKSPEQIRLADGEIVRGYEVPLQQIAMSTENIHTDYAETDTSVVFRLENKNKIRIAFPRKGGCILIPEPQGRYLDSPRAFKQAFPLTVTVVPVLGPLDHEEPVVEAATVQRNLTTHLASRHFRNFWSYYPDGFSQFADMVRTTWPGMEIEPPENVGSTLRMFCRENRITRELYWSGFGFQIWCQLLTHLVRATDDAILIVDEPEIYLHPDVQRQLLSILRGLGPNILLATHSTEIISEADPGEIVLVDKSSRSAERLKDVAGVQLALEQIGSIQNITLTRLARHRRVLFVEGLDFKLLTRFAKTLGMHELAAGNGIADVESEGFSNWKRVRDVAWGINKTLGTPLSIAAVLDRDYRCKEEVEQVRKELARYVALIHIHDRKEIENYLLVLHPLQRAISTALGERHSDPAKVPPTLDEIEKILFDITSKMQVETQSQYISKHMEFFRGTKEDAANHAKEGLGRFERQWRTLDSRLQIVPGKEVLSKFRERIKCDYGVTLTDQRIVRAFKRQEIPSDLRTLLELLNKFRVLPSGATKMPLANR
jgi:predicted ATPase